jgi:hypothetical protein
MNKFSYIQVSDKINELIAVRKKDKSVDPYVATTGTLSALLGMLVSGVATAENVMNVLDKEIAQEAK